MSDEQKPEETKQDMITAAKGLPATEVFSLKPRTFEEAFRFANLIATSTLIPKEFQNSPANVLIAVQLGMELGVAPMQALQNIAVVNGRPVIWGDLVPAIVYQSGLCEQFDEQGDNTRATCTVKRKGFPAITRSFTMDQAKLAGLAERQTYKQYPARMLQMRARGFAVRDAFPDVLKGVHLREEQEDLEPRDVTPIKQPQALEKKEDGKVADRQTDSREPQTGRGAGEDSGDVAPSTRRNRPRAEKAEENKTEAPPPEPSAEQSQEDLINSLVLWCEAASDAEITDKQQEDWLFAELKKVKGTVNQMKVLKPFNDRRQAIAKH